MNRPVRKSEAVSRYLVRLASQTDVTGWRNAARALALSDVPPEAVSWQVEDAPEQDLFGGESDILPLPRPDATLNVPKAFLETAETVICHSDRSRFDLLYCILTRFAGEPHLLRIATDADIAALAAMEKSVGRDIHKMRAFVRFRRLDLPQGERYVAWFEPRHFIVERNAAFFVRRFTGMRWTILTPQKSVDWDGERLSFGPGADRTDAPAEDGLETLWTTYFESIFNPARLKVKAMQAEMPKKYWRNLPEASSIPQLISGAPAASRSMVERLPTMPAPHHQTVQKHFWSRKDDPRNQDDGSEAATIDELRHAAETCRRCPLWKDATQTVFGEGPETADVIFVGEQPGDQEDLAGKPFVGPAGRVFDLTLREAGLDRTKTYVTNAVKHFKFEPRGKRRLHKKPNAGEISACRWWLDKEIDRLSPKLAVALGATAAQSLLGKPVAVTKLRGDAITREDGLKVFITIHPSFILRIQDAADKQAEQARFLADIRKIRQMIGD